MSKVFENTIIGVNCNVATLGVPAVRGEESYVQRVMNFPIALDVIKELKGIVKFVGVTQEFKDVIDYFKVPEGQTPAGFRIELSLEADGVLKFDLVRDISYDKNGKKRPTNILFSADSANPYEIAPCANLLANLTCNPGIVYDLFINNPKANVGGKFKTRDEVMEEIGKILGPGCDISVELNNPFESDFGKILEEAAKFREMLSKWRVVIKVPHTGPVNAENVNQLLEGNKLLNKRWNAPATADAFRGHNLALKLRDEGYRINFTLMFEPHQTALALQAKPYFINSFVRHRMMQSGIIKGYVDAYYASHDEQYLKLLRTFLIEKDYLASTDTDYDLTACKRMGKQLIKYRQFETAEGCDGLDGVRHNLRMLRQVNLPDTRLIICSMEGDRNYPEIDQLMASPEYSDMVGKVVITAEPNYLAQFSSANQVVSYNRRFMNAAKGMK
jgi:hypothetical protein